MGYDLHITRREDWSDPESGPPITRDEFERVVTRDKRFRRDEGLGPEYAVVVKKPRGAIAESWLCWEDGQITVRGSSRSLITIAVEIAVTLGARLVGDDGEEYGADGRALRDKAEEHEKDVSPEGTWDSSLAESDADMQRRLNRERAVRILQWAGVIAFCALTVALLGRQMGWW